MRSSCLISSSAAAFSPGLLILPPGWTPAPIPLNVGIPAETETSQKKTAGPKAGRSAGCKPDSVDWTWVQPETIHLCDLPGSYADESARNEQPLLPYSVLLRVGFTLPRSVTTLAVSSYLTISPLPILSRGRRYLFCGTFPGIAPGGSYPPHRPAESGLSSALIQ